MTWSVNRVEMNALAYDGFFILLQQIGNIGYFKLSDRLREYLLQHEDLIATPNEPRPERSGHEWMI